MFFGAIEEIVVQLTNHAQGQVLEGQSGTVEHLRHVQVVIESRDLDRHFRVLEGLEGLLHQPVKVLPGKVLLSDRVAKTCRPCRPVGAIFSGRCQFLGKARVYFGLFLVYFGLIIWC